MALFSMTTVDNALSWNGSSPGQTSFIPETNNQNSDTQGFLRKSQKGKIRNRALVKIECTNSAFDNTIAPMLVYPADVNVAFERNIPLRNTNTGRFTFENAEPSQEDLQFESSNQGTGEFILEFVEVLF